MARIDWNLITARDPLVGDNAMGFDSAGVPVRVILKSAEVDPGPGGGGDPGGCPILPDFVFSLDDYYATGQLPWSSQFTPQPGANTLDLTHTGCDGQVTLMSTSPGAPLDINLTNTGSEDLVFSIHLLDDHYVAGKVVDLVRLSAGQVYNGIAVASGNIIFQVNAGLPNKNIAYTIEVPAYAGGAYY